jgi:hypothetical protein
MKTTTSILALIAFASAAGGASAQSVIAYPAKGQDSVLQAKDTAECQAWSTNTTGFDPATPPPTYQAAPKASGGVAKGAVGGAAIGVIAGDSSKAAGRGAAAGAVFGGARQGVKNSNSDAQSKAQYDAANAQYQTKRSDFNRALTACLSGRGYTVK